MFGDSSGVTRSRSVVFLALAGALALFAFALAGPARIEPADFTFVNSAEVASLDPATVTGIPEGRILRFLFEGLCVKDPRTLAPVPGVAESWAVSPDGRTYTFHLRADARWSNGDPVTAHDFAASFERLLDPRTGAEYAYQLWYVRGAKAFTTEVDARGAPVHAFDTVAIRAASARELAIELDSPTPYFLDLVSSCALFPTHAKSIAAARARWPETWQTRWTRPEILVTNGPYRVLERRVNDRIRFVANPHYWDRANVAFETVDALAVEHLDTRLNLYLTGAVSWVDGVPASLIPRLVPREDFEPAPYLATYFYRVNVTRPPLDDRRVRRALALAIDRRAITERITKAGEAPLWSCVPPGLESHAPVEMAHARTGDHAADHAADIAEAQRLIAEVGFGPGRRPWPPIEIHYNTGATHADVAEVIADGWRTHLGLDAKFANQEWKVFLATQVERDYDVSRSSWIGDYPDAFGFLDIFASESENNRTGWSDPRYDALLAEAQQVLGAERARLLALAETLLMEELPILPIHAYATQNLVDPRLGGFFENALDEHFPKFWYWMDDEELAAKRTALPQGQEIVTSNGPREGLYPPAHPKYHPRNSTP